ncbi:MAG: hypothetical protein NAOJABEB_02293 [Steroidobacteraceae bacterium]|nr:hypothetical protein [Steroidobacteraceae bacterium]
MRQAHSPSIDLAREPDFELGGLQVRPSAREVTRGHEVHTLEPRVMQVLVALARRRGATVSRDSLIAGCWGGAIVGEDAIQRCIGRLRRLAGAVGGFEIETLSRIGYRLHDLSPRPSRTLAVLPFDNLSGDPAMTYVADGVADEILQAIARRSSITTIGRTSSFQFRGADKNVARIGDVLGATHVLDGSVRRAGARVRIAAHLMSLADQQMVWSDRFDGDADDLFVLQDSVAAAAVAALDGAMNPAGVCARRPAEVHDLVLQLHDWTGPPAVDALPARLAKLERLEALAADDAGVWGVIAAARASLCWVASAAERPRLRDRARSAAERALAIDARTGEAHKALYLLEPAIGRFHEIEQRLLAARAAAPDDGEIHWSLYAHYLSVGRLRESFVAAERAYRVDPLRPANAMAYANALFTTGEERQALGLMHHALDRWPRDPVVFAIALWTAASAGQFSFVDDVMAKAPVDRFPEDAQRLIEPAILAIGALRARSADALEGAMGRLRAEVGAAPLRFSLIGLCAALGADLVELFDLVERVDFEPLRRADVTLPAVDGLAHLFLRVNARLRESPRFVELCRTLGLVDYWIAAGAWPDCVAETAPHYDFVARARASR